MHALITDLRFAFRTLARSPAFTLVAIATLVLGIGANTAIFSIVNAVLLEPLPYAEPDRLVRIHGTTPQNDAANVNPLDALDWRAENRSFERLAVLHNSELTLAGDSEPIRAAVTRVTHDFFETLGVQPAIGRTFSPAEETPGNDRVAIVSHAFWLSWFGGSADALAKTIRIADQRYEIVGVLPAGFRTPVPGHHGETSIYRPMALDPERTGRGGHYTQVIARLRPNVTLAQAQQEMIALTEDLERRFPGDKTGRRASLIPLTETIVGNYRKSLVVLMVAVGFVLLLACTNVASLFLARAAGREREMSIRSAVGAARGRLIRQLMTESFVLALIGGLAAVFAGSWLASLLRSAGAGIVPRLDEASIDLRVLGFTALAAAGSAFLFGILPAIRASRASASLKEDRSLGTGKDVRRALRWMIVAEVAISILLLSGAGLLIRSLWTLSNVKPGFDAENVLFLRIGLSPDQYPEDPQVVGFYDEMRRRLERNPQIAAAGATSILPFSGGFSCDSYALQGAEVGPASMRPCAEVRVVTEGYFEAMGIPLLGGRTFQSADHASSQPVVLVSRSMASRIGANPIGTRIRAGSVADDEWQVVVGITDDVRHFGLAQQPEPEIYLLNRQAPYYGMTMVARVHGPLEAALPVVRAEIRQLDPTLPVNALEPISVLVSRSLAENRLRALLLGSFALIALLLAASGIYGVLSHGVANRTRELGVRMALGASRRGVLASVLGEALRFTALGTAIGVLATVAVSKLIESLLFEISPLDPLTFASAVAVLFAVAMAASWVPARRATKVDPMTALRSE